MVKDIISYPGILAEPQAWSHVPGLAGSENLKRRRHEARVFRACFDALFDHYGIAPGQDALEKLASALAKDHEPGVPIGELMKRYGTEPKGSGAMDRLAIALALEHVPGLSWAPAENAFVARYGQRYLEPRRYALDLAVILLCDLCIRTYRCRQEKSDASGIVAEIMLGGRRKKAERCETVEKIFGREVAALLDGALNGLGRTKQVERGKIEQRTRITRRALMKLIAEMRTAVPDFCRGKATDRQVFFVAQGRTPFYWLMERLMGPV